MTVNPNSSVSSVRRARHCVSGVAMAVATTVSIAGCSSDATDGATAASIEQPTAEATTPPPTAPPADATTVAPAPETTTAPPSTTTADATTVAPGPATATANLLREVGGEGKDVPVTFTLPDGWETDVVDAVLKGEPEVGVLFWGGFTRIYTDSCPSTTIDPPPGPTVDDFASAWADLPAFDATVPTDISVDGYAGKLVEFTVPDYDEADCPYGDFMLMGDASGDGYWAQEPNGHHKLLILDVDGTRAVITAFWYADTSTEDRAEIDQILNSIQIG